MQKTVFGLKTPKGFKDITWLIELLDGLYDQFEFGKLLVIDNSSIRSGLKQWSEVKKVECEITNPPYATRGSKGAEFVVNTNVVRRATNLVCVHDSLDNNLRHFINAANKNNKPIYVFKYHG